MKTVLYSLETPAGTFWIQPQPAGRVLLGIDNHRLKTYGSVTDATDAVSHRTTGYAEWDDAEGERRPVPLRQWRKGARSAKGDSPNKQRSQKLE